MRAADAVVDRLGGRRRLIVRRMRGRSAVGLAHQTQAQRTEPAARRRAQQYDSGPVHVRCAEPAAGLERALPGHVQHRSQAYLARLHHPRSARRAHRGRHVSARSRPLRRRAARGPQGRQHLHPQRRMADGRIIDVINQPIEGGGWVAMHEDITERKKAERELEHTRSFLDTIIENVPSPIIVKGAQEPALHADQPRRRAISRRRPQHDARQAGSEVMPKVTADRSKSRTRN